MYQELLSVVAGRISFHSTMSEVTETIENDGGGSNKVAPPPPPLPSVKEDVVYNEEDDVSQRRLARTREVKVLVSPIMQRMKASLAKIQDLEESLNRSKHLVQSSEEQEHQSVGGSSCSSTHVHRRSRRLLKNSMRMLKSKLTALQQMEESLRISEDRQQHLLHHVLQVTSSMQYDKLPHQIPLKSIGSEDEEMKDQVTALEKERGQLELASHAVGPLEEQLKSMREELSNMQQLKQELEATKEKCSLLEDDLVQRQYKINQQAIQCDELECEVEQLKAMCDDLLKKLKAQEERNEELVQEMKLERPSRISRDYQTQSSTSSTSPESDSSTLGSSSAEEDQEDLQMDQPNQSDEEERPLFRLQKLASSVFSKGQELANSHTNKNTPSADRIPKDVGTSGMKVLTDCEPLAATKSEQDAGTIHRLIAKIELIDQENADLVQSQQEMMEKFHALLQTNARQADRIAQLERQVKQYESQPDGVSIKELSPTKQENEEPNKDHQIVKTKSVEESKKTTSSTSFFRKLLQSDAKQLKSLLEATVSSTTSSPIEETHQVQVWVNTSDSSCNDTEHDEAVDVNNYRHSNVSMALIHQQHIPFGQLESVAE